MEIVLYQDFDLKEECNFDGYQRFKYSEEDQEFVWVFRQGKDQAVFGFKIGNYSKKFNVPKRLGSGMRLSIMMDDKKRVRQFNKASGSSE